MFFGLLYQPTDNFVEVFSTTSRPPYVHLSDPIRTTAIARRGFAYPAENGIVKVIAWAFAARTGHGAVVSWTPDRQILWQNGDDPMALGTLILVVANRDRTFAHEIAFT